MPPCGLTSGRLAESTKQLIQKYVKNPMAVLTMKQEATPLNINSIKDLTWQYVTLSDAAKAFELALETRLNGSRIYNIGASDTCSDWESLKLVKTLYPNVPIHDADEFVRNPKKALWSISKAQKELKFEPEFNWRRVLKEFEK